MKYKTGLALGGVHLLMLLILLVPFLVAGETFDDLVPALLDGQRQVEMFLLTTLLLTVDVFIPVPSSVVSVSAGMILGAPVGFVACLTGLTGGSLLGYGFGYYFRRLNLQRWVEDQAFRELSAQFSRYGYMVLIVCRGVPLMAELSVVIAGFHRYPLRRFLGVTSAANVVLAGLYSVLGGSVAGVGAWYLVLVTFFLVPAATFGLRLLWLRGGLRGTGA